VCRWKLLASFFVISLLRPNRGFLFPSVFFIVSGPLPLLRRVISFPVSPWRCRMASLGLVISCPQTEWQPPSPSGFFDYLFYGHATAVFSFCTCSLSHLSFASDLRRPQTFLRSWKIKFSLAPLPFPAVARPTWALP